YLFVALGGLIVEQELIILPIQVFLLVTGIMAGLFVLTGLLLGNRQRARFVVSAKGVEYHAAKRERALSRLAVVAGLFARNATAAGAGVLAASREDHLVPWSAIEKVIVHPGARVIVLRNSWRTVQRLYCPADRFDSIAEAVTAYHGAHGDTA
ncbi:MAG: hypothetical protein ACYC6C_10635, partial [Coriobacteriia bacterium]